MAKTSLLDHLRTRSQVACDTLDASIASSLGPFIDCTSNQAIAYLELAHTRHEETIKQARQLAQELAPSYPDVSVQALAVDIAMILLALSILPHLTGAIHIQVNPLFSYSTVQIITNAQRIHSLFAYLAPSHPSHRIVVKIPTTWEGLAAIRALEAAGIKCLATTLFTMEQAALAARCGATYIAPYVNELRVHFDEDGYRDPAPNFGLCVQAQRYYKAHGYKTTVLPASLTSPAEVMDLAGADAITISPRILEWLAKDEYVEMWRGKVKAWASLFDDEVTDQERQKEQEVWRDLEEVEVQEKYRMMVTRRNGGRQEEKLVQAINIFADFQAKLEALMV